MSAPRFLMHFVLLDERRVSQQIVGAVPQQALPPCIRVNPVGSVVVAIVINKNGLRIDRIISMEKNLGGDIHIDIVVPQQLIKTPDFFEKRRPEHSLVHIEDAAVGHAAEVGAMNLRAGDVLDLQRHQADSGITIQNGARAIEGAVPQDVVITEPAEVICLNRRRDLIETASLAHATRIADNTQARLGLQKLQSSIG